MLRLPILGVFALAMISGTGAIAQSKPKSTAAQKQAVYDHMRQLSPAQRQALFLRDHKRKPDLSAYLKDKTIPVNNSRAKSEGGRAFAKVAAGARFPGEFEEVQAVFISWPYFSASAIDTMLNSNLSGIYQLLADGIQQAGAKVYINVWDNNDTTAVKEFMVRKGTPLTDYRFFVYSGDDIWARDFGPVSYYYGDDDSLGWVDFRYYPGRDLDNVLTDHWGAELNIPVTHSSLYFEGGNILTDGQQNLYTSTALYELNAFINGYTARRSVDSLKDIMQLSRAEVLNRLPHDGGTGHIDLYLDMTDENTFVHTRMPEAMRTISFFTDYDTVIANMARLNTLSSPHSKPYRFYSIPLPTRDDGSWYTSGPNYEVYTRTYSNHLIVNKTIIQPIFSNATSGNAAGDAAAIDSIKKAYPGYKILPIDMRFLDGSGGSIHCITKEVYADNPLRFSHYAYRDLEAYQSSYPIDAVITNRSGIASATLYWRLKGVGSWNTVAMTAAAGNHWLASIPAAATVTSETFEYYISATSVNGKTLTRPMPGEDGPYVFWYDKAVSIPSVPTPGFTLGNLYPNPATDLVNLEVIATRATKVSLHITDISGKVLKQQNFGTISNSRYLQIQTQELPAGIYMIHVFADGQETANRKLVKK